MIATSGMDPETAISDHTIEEEEELTHTGDEGDLLRFSSGKEPMVEVCDDRVVAGRCESSHIESLSDS